MLRRENLDDVMSFLRLAFAAWYVTVAMHTAYGGRWRLAIGRSAVVLVSYAAVVTMVIALLFGTVFALDS